MSLYKTFMRPLAFSLDSERVHRIAMAGGSFARGGPLHSVLKSMYSHSDSRLATVVAGLRFKNPVGLAAGFDKDCECPELFSALGFGFIELGTVTAEPQSGNPRPRIFRLPADKALINRMGFPSCGVQEFSKRLQALKKERIDARIGINIGKSKSALIDKALADYLKSMRQVNAYGDYFSINISSPNTPELRKLQEPARLRELLSGLQSYNESSKPLFVKIAPDLELKDLDALLDICLEMKVSGLIATNTTFSREGLRTKIDQQGGLSGAPLHQRACEFVRHIVTVTGKAIPVIGVGGVVDAESALDFFKAGASLVQVYTGLIYEGPGIAQKICRGLSHSLDRHGCTSLTEFCDR